MDTKMWVYMSLSMIGVALVWFLVIPASTSGDPLTLEYIQGYDYGRHSEGSSLPSRFVEQVVEDVPASTELMRRTNVPALFTVFPVPYETIRDRLLSKIRQVFGEDRFFEEKHDDNIEWNEWYGQAADPDGFHEQRRREKEQKLASAGILWQSYQEARIMTKTYNEVWWKRGRSQAMFRIIDGRDLFGHACTIVLFTRTDHELRFGFLHTIPIPVIFMGDDLLATDREVSLIEQVKNELGIPIAYFVAGVRSLLDNAVPLLEIKDYCVNTSSPSKR